MKGQKEPIYINDWTKKDNLGRSVSNEVINVQKVDQKSKLLPKIKTEKQE